MHVYEIFHLNKPRYQGNANQMSAPVVLPSPALSVKAVHIIVLDKGPWLSREGDPEDDANTGVGALV